MLGAWIIQGHCGLRDAQIEAAGHLFGISERLESGVRTSPWGTQSNAGYRARKQCRSLIPHTPNALGQRPFSTAKVARYRKTGDCKTSTLNPKP